MSRSSGLPGSTRSLWICWSKVGQTRCRESAEAMVANDTMNNKNIKDSLRMDDLPSQWIDESMDDAARIRNGDTAPERQSARRGAGRASAMKKAPSPRG